MTLEITISHYFNKRQLTLDKKQTMAILKEKFFLSTHVVCMEKWFEQKHLKNSTLSPTVKMHVYCMSAKTIEFIYQECHWLTRSHIKLEN